VAIFTRPEEAYGASAKKAGTKSGPGIQVGWLPGEKSFSGFKVSKVSMRSQPEP
jgi:hypothetical protein